MEVTKWEDMRVKYPEDRDKMSDERHREFVEDCFKLYEQEGFNDTFSSPYTDYEEYKGMKFTVVRRATEIDTDLEVLPMWKIRFEDGKELFAYPEELIMSEIEFNGYNK